MELIRGSQTVQCCHFGRTLISPKVRHKSKKSFGQHLDNHMAYKDQAELSTLRRSSTDIDSSVEKTVLVNPKCQVRVMLEYIRKACRLGIYTKFDLCDESGGLKGLFGLPTYAYATDMFVQGRVYYVIVLRTEPDKRISVLPQLNWDNRLYLELKAKVVNFLLTGDTSPMTSSAGKTTPPHKVGGKKK